MLIARPGQASPQRLEPTSATTDVGAEVVWLDLLHPTAEESALASRISGLRVPTRAELDEIESSSRLFREGGALYLSTPLIRRIDELSSIMSLGLIVSESHLITIRFADYPAFDVFAKAVETSARPLDAASLLIGLLEALTDRLADVLELVAAEIERASSGIFHSQLHDQSKQADRRLRGLLKNIGRQGGSVSQIRDSLLGLRRLTLFVENAMDFGSSPELKNRLLTIGHDLQSLNEFDGQVTEKVHFLLDATLGLINIEQNNGIRILTVVSIIGIPPTLIASIYGMNFKNIPELNWSFGYWYALALMLASVILPLAWFRRVGWV